MYTHIYLAGDSIFDNKVYVKSSEPAVADQAAVKIPEGKVVLVAKDGDRTSNVLETQLPMLKQYLGANGKDAVIVLSVGGNDALGAQTVLWQSDDQLLHLGLVVHEFAKSYQQALQELLLLGVPIIACTIYEGDLPERTATERAWKLVALTALGCFNDVIVRAATEFGVPVLDLRRVVFRSHDFVDVIEPSAEGGERIAEAITSAVRDLAQKQWSLRAPGVNTIYG